MELKKAKAHLLLTEGSFHAVYLIRDWYESFKDTTSFKGIVIRDNQGNSEQKVQFHRTFSGKKQLTENEYSELLSLYGTISEAEKSMISLYGIPSYPADVVGHIHYSGPNLNHPDMEAFISSLTKEYDLTVYIFLDQILKPWWIEYTEGNIINAHSAVLPYARGMYAIENMAVKGNQNDFQRAAGASIHYVDNGIDTGPIIRAVRIKDPFRYESIWEVKATSYRLAFELLVNQAGAEFENPDLQYVGVKSDKNNLGENFLSKNFDEDKKKVAQEQFLSMKKSQMSFKKAWEART
ncbi:formyltransferase family protein [Brevibacillus laterosporus]|uniref:formyltransferase family protein n=1 Tax=Brevibacillus laterosporus TaxID=1465 RepID=UPI0003044149|nr:formyltransferase family protein [Brevibacillus laterosporus]AUM63768.1 hypothetical protein C0R09_04150 [Brevibacillus laterosporus]AYK06756.1 hypothetical protein D8Z77_10520 [Brevibacillus laterosporus]WPS88653.1 formyltransferase family protein [Brevibacillus halotolerans]